MNISQKPKFVYRLMLPFEPGVKEMGSCTQEDLMRFFQNYNWNEMLESIAGKDWEDLVNSPGIQIEKVGAQEFLRITNIGKVNQHEFTVSYTRPYTQKYFFGLWSKFYPAYATYKVYQSPEQVMKYIVDFFEGKINV